MTSYNELTADQKIRAHAVAGASEITAAIIKSGAQIADRPADAGMLAVTLEMADRLARYIQLGTTR